jgi:hypothetical protein
LIILTSGYTRGAYNLIQLMMMMDDDDGDDDDDHAAA